MGGKSGCIAALLLLGPMGLRGALLLAELRSCRSAARIALRSSILSLSTAARFLWAAVKSLPRRLQASCCMFSWRCSCWLLTCSVLTWAHAFLEASMSSMIPMPAGGAGVAFLSRLMSLAASSCRTTALQVSQCKRPFDKGTSEGGAGAQPTACSPQFTRQMGELPVSVTLKQSVSVNAEHLMRTRAQQAEPHQGRRCWRRLSLCIACTVGGGCQGLTDDPLGPAGVALNVMSMHTSRWAAIQAPHKRM